MRISIFPWLNILASVGFEILFAQVPTDTEIAVDLDIEFSPRFDYGHVDPTFVSTDRGIRAEGDEEQTLLETPMDLDIVDERVTGRFVLEDGSTEWLLLRCTGAEDADTDLEGALTDIIQYWRDWTDTCSEDGSNCIFETTFECTR